MDKLEYRQHIGVSKTLYNSGVTIINSQGAKFFDQTTILTERVLRSKSSGNWPFKPLLKLLQENYINYEKLEVSDNRDVITPSEYEDHLNDVIPFDQTCSSSQLDCFTSKNKVEFIGHHMAHAYCALRFSPFEKSIVLVIDGAGSEFSCLDHDDRTVNINRLENIRQHEEYSIYLQVNGTLECVEKKWQTFYKLPGLNKNITNGLGIGYETVAEYIFGSNQAAGKVMGLASFGSVLPRENIEKLLEGLDWSKSFTSSEQSNWEKSPHLELYRNLAATIQLLYEKEVSSLLLKIKQSYADFENLIIVGGCALNCTNNSKIIINKLFKSLYIPPCPDDRGISVGLAYRLYLRRNFNTWKPLLYKDQTSSFGLKSSIPSDDLIRSVFDHDNYKIIYVENISKTVGIQLANNKIIAWFDGFSECGPRALGHRSILASPMFPDLKSYLNTHIKFREGFRPYGASCLYEKRGEYFVFPRGLETPFMSFTIPVQSKYREILRHISHVDNTSRVQTVRQEQNKKLYATISYFGEITGIFCVLNTSLNIMGEAIVENIYDLKTFFDSTPVDAIAIGSFYITRIKNIY